MQLKLRRSQKTGGILGDTAIFILDVRAELTPEETANVQRYKLWNQIIFNSKASENLIAQGQAKSDGSTMGHLKNIGFLALAATKLNISIKSLVNGHHIELKDLQELIGTEEALKDACEDVQKFLAVAETFDGREVAIDFEVAYVGEFAHANAVPSPALAMTGAPPSLPGPVPAMPHLADLADAAAAARPAAAFASAGAPDVSADPPLTMRDVRQMLGGGALSHLANTWQQVTIYSAGAAGVAIVLMLMAHAPFLVTLLVVVLVVAVAQNLLTRL